MKEQNARLSLATSLLAGFLGVAGATFAELQKSGFNVTTPSLWLCSISALLLLNVVNMYRKVFSSISKKKR